MTWGFYDDEYDAVDDDGDGDAEPMASRWGGVDQNIDDQNDDDGDGGDDDDFDQNDDDDDGDTNANNNTSVGYQTKGCG